MAPPELNPRFPRKINFLHTACISRVSIQLTYDENAKCIKYSPIYIEVNQAESRYTFVQAVLTLNILGLFVKVSGV